MSRIGKLPVVVPSGVDVTVAEQTVTVKGPKGTLKIARAPGVDVKLQGQELTLDVSGGDFTMAGTTRSLIQNMVKGVSEGYQKKLELVGVGYRAAMQGKDLNLTLGFSHPVLFKAPAGITLETPSQTEVLVKGADKQLVGEAAAKIRAFRPPEPYKGKGVRYSGEKISLKEAKKA